MRTVPRRVLPHLALVAVAAALLAGGTPQDAVPGGDLTDGPNPSGDPSGEPAPTLAAAPVGTPIDIPCDDLVSADTIYLYNPNFTLIDDFTPSDGSIAASALEYSGLACRWQNQTSGDNIDLSIAELDDATLTALKNAAFQDSTMVPTYGEEAYFTVTGQVGTAQVFQGTYWIVVESPAFFEPGDATEIVNSVLTALG